MSAGQSAMLPKMSGYAVGWPALRSQSRVGLVGRGFNCNEAQSIFRWRRQGSSSICPDRGGKQSTVGLQREISSAGH
jgi:hypothetical protein